MSVICSLMSSNIKSSPGRRLEPILSTWMAMDKFNTRNNYRLRVMSFDKNSGNARQHHLESPEQRSTTEDENSSSETESCLEKISLPGNRSDLSIPITTQTSSPTISHRIPTIQTVRRRLFSDSSTDPETDRIERQRYLDEQLQRINREKCEKYNFDFVTGTPLNRPGATYEWQRIATSSTVLEQCSTSSSTSMTKVATCSCITTSTTRQTSLIGMLPVRCKSRTSTTTVSTVCRGIKRPLSSTSTSTEKLSSEEGLDSKRSKLMVSGGKIGSSKFVEHTAASSSPPTLRTQSPTNSTTSTSSSDTVIVEYSSDEQAQY